MIKLQYAEYGMCDKRVQKALYPYLCLFVNALLNNISEPYSEQISFNVPTESGDEAFQATLAYSSTSTNTFAVMLAIPTNTSAIADKRIGLALYEFINEMDEMMSLALNMIHRVKDIDESKLNPKQQAFIHNIKILSDNFLRGD